MAVTVTVAAVELEGLKVSVLPLDLKDADLVVVTFTRPGGCDALSTVFRTGTVTVTMEPAGGGYTRLALARVPGPETILLPPTPLAPFVLTPPPRPRRRPTPASPLTSLIALPCLPFTTLPPLNVPPVPLPLPLPLPPVPLPFLTSDPLPALTLPEPDKPLPVNLPEATFLNFLRRDARVLNADESDFEREGGVASVVDNVGAMGVLVPRADVEVRAGVDVDERLGSDMFVDAVVEA